MTVPDEGEPPYCSFCACPIYDQKDLVRIFAGEQDEEGAIVYWSLDDGSGEVISAEAGQEVAPVSQKAFSFSLIRHQYIDRICCRNMNIPEM